jgi:hypothetical protein
VINPLVLNRFQRGVPIVDSSGSPTMAEQAREQRNLEAIEEAINAVIDAQNAADAANAAAAAANTAALAAENAAEAATDQSALASSGVSGLSITANDAGSNVTITISAHTRIYGNGISVSVAGGSLTAQPYSTDIYIYYDDAARTGGAVTYQATTSIATAAQTGNRHSLGAVTTPAALGAPVDGRNNLPPGVVEP